MKFFRFKTPLLVSKTSAPSACFKILDCHLMRNFNSLKTKLNHRIQHFREELSCAAGSIFSSSLSGPERDTPAKNGQSVSKRKKKKEKLKVERKQHLTDQ